MVRGGGFGVDSGTWVSISTACSISVYSCYVQLAIVGTGNYAWINFIGALPMLSLLDDHFLSHFFSEEAVTASKAALEATLEGADQQPQRHRVVRLLRRLWAALRATVYIILAVVIAYKSKDPVKELFSQQVFWGSSCCLFKATP